MKYVSTSLQTLENEYAYVVEGSNFEILKIFPSNLLYHKVCKFCTKITVLFLETKITVLFLGIFQEKPSFKRLEYIIF